MTAAHECPICSAQFDEFLPSSPTRPRKAKCPSCGSAERHRFFALLLKRMPDLLPDGTMLHFAPEAWLENEMTAKYGEDGYIRVDYQNYGIDARVDIQNLAFADESFNAVLCFSVLEHVPNDYKAMDELARVCRPGATVCIHVPLQYKSHASMRDALPAKERKAKYGQYDHLRYYGLDIVETLGERFASAELIRTGDVFSAPEQARFGLNERVALVVCKR
jgi:SAM-dependent methyltransferase